MYVKAKRLTKSASSMPKIGDPCFCFPTISIVGPDSPRPGDAVTWNETDGTKVNGIAFYSDERGFYRVA